MLVLVMSKHYASFELPHFSISMSFSMKNSNEMLQNLAKKIFLGYFRYITELDSQVSSKNMTNFIAFHWNYSLSKPHKIVMCVVSIFSSSIMLLEYLVNDELWIMDLHDQV